MLFLLGSLMLLFNCSVTKGQGCRTVLQPEFSVYNTSSRDGYNIYTSVSIQGYANIAPGPGCNMSVATHHVGAENKLNNVDHWTYSANGCPTCYFSATDTESIVGVPGVVYPWVTDGQAICSIVGSFWGGSGGGGLPGCLVPSTETTAVAGVVEGNITVTAFDQTISDTATDNFNGYMIVESDAASPADSCYGTWSLWPKNTGVSGGNWPVGGGQVAGESNHWGWDLVGWSTYLVTYYRVQAPAHGIPLPCGFVNYQALTIQCTAGGTVKYTPSAGNKLTGDIYAGYVKNCRYDISGWACQETPF
jgi:hypothetical protein